MTQHDFRGNCAGADNGRVVNYDSVGHPAESRGTVKTWRDRRSIVERFWSRVNRDGPVHPQLGTACWLWVGSAVARYGQIGLGHPSTPGSKRWKTHRFSWELHRGPIPDGLRVCHRCDVPLCVNPDHLFLGTQLDNIRDAIRKGRRKAWGRQRLTPDDVRIIRAQAQRGMLQKDIARAFRISRNNVSQIVNRVTWPHVD